MTLLARLLPVAALVLIGATAVAQDGHPAGRWRIEAARVAPWAPVGTTPDPVLRGREVRFEVDRVVGPEPLGCEGARYEWRFIGAEGLFEGNLPAPAAGSARRLGITGSPVATLRVTCRNAGFDFHRGGAGELLLGLDNVVWTLRQTRSGAVPAAVVQELLIDHFTHDMALSRDGVERKRPFLSSTLGALLAARAAAPATADEAPLINGDPFTDSQEYPDRFALGPVGGAPERPVVPVRFADEYSARRVDYVLVREGGRWLVDDLVDERGQSLRVLLAPAAAAAGGPDDFDAFLGRFRAALASGRAAEVAALVRVPFLYEGRELDRAGVAAIVPGLFTPQVTRCLATAMPMPEGDRRVAFCSPYAFYFGRDVDGYRLIEFAADGEDMP